MYIEDICEDTW